MQQRVWHSSYDEGVPTTLAFDNHTLIDNLYRAAADFPNRPALVFMNTSITYRALLDAVEQLATALVQYGVNSGDRVAIQMPNLPQFVLAYYGILRANAVATPTNPLYTAGEIEHQWNDAGAEIAIVMDYIYASRIRARRDSLRVRQYVIASIPEYLRFPLNVLAPLKLKRQTPQLIAKVPEDANVVRFRKLVEGTPRKPPPISVGPQDIATLLYTGGTTGVSKGAALTHRNLAYNVEQMTRWIPQLAWGQEVVLTMLPLFHSYGLTVAMNVGVSLAATLVLIPNPRDIAGIMRAIAKHRATLAPAVPATYNAIIRHPKVAEFDLSSVKLCNSGSAPLPVDVLEEFERVTGGKITEGFGLTETSPVTHTNPIGGNRKVGSIGVPIPDTDAKIVDAETGSRDLPPGEVGELLVSGPQVMRGYWNREEETHKIMKGGWLYTGDLARMDEDGFFFIEGRKKDMIISSGFNVYPDEIDRVLMAHPAVLEAATIGIPDEKRGENAKSFIVLRPGESVTAEELLSHCRELMAPYKVPRSIEFRTELPKSTVLKILRRELRAEEMAKLGR